MSQKHKFDRSRGKRRKQRKLVIVLTCIAVVLAILLGVMLFLISRREVPTPTVPTTVPTTAPTVPTETTEPTEPAPEMLENMAELYAQNPDIVGWIRMEDTLLDYAVMHTPDDEEKYLRTSFDGHFSVAGVPFIDKDCSVDPESDNLIIYGHNMGNGTAFACMNYYGDVKYWEKHPTVYYSTLYEERTYEVFSAFLDHVYFNYEDVFKFYEFVDYEDEEDFARIMEILKDKAMYDTGVEPEYGDKFITMVTCSSHEADGRFVVVLRQVPEDELQPAETTAPVE